MHMLKIFNFYLIEISVAYMNNELFIALFITPKSEITMHGIIAFFVFFYGFIYYAKKGVSLEI